MLKGDKIMSSVLALVLFFGAQFGQTATVTLFKVCFYEAPLVKAQMVKNPPAMWETQVRFLGRGDP